MLCRFSFPTMAALATRMPGLQQQLFRLLSQDIGKAALLAGNYTADERMAAFLISLSRRYAARGFSANRFRLTMTRTDIANYLRLASESVSRVFRRFQDDGLIRVDRRESSCSERPHWKSWRKTCYATDFPGKSPTRRPLDLGQSARSLPPEASAYHTGRCIMSATRRLWVGLAVLLVPIFRRPPLGRRRNSPRHATDSTAVVTDGRQDDLYTRRHSKRAARSGSRSAASSSVRSGVTAATWRRTGRADWLHREAVAWLDIEAQRNTSQALCGACRRDAQRRARRPPAAANPRATPTSRDRHVTVSDDAPPRSRNVAAHYDSLFGNDPALHELRKAYAMKERHGARCRASRRR